MSTTTLPGSEIDPPVTHTYRITYDPAAIRENQCRQASGTLPARLVPAVVVVDEDGAVHRAHSIRTLGEVTYRPVQTKEEIAGIRELSDVGMIAVTTGAVELTTL